MERFTSRQPPPPGRWKVPAPVLEPDDLGAAVDLDRPGDSDVRVQPSPSPDLDPWPDEPAPVHQVREDRRLRRSTESAENAVDYDDGDPGAYGRDIYAPDEYVAEMYEPDLEARDDYQSDPYQPDPYERSQSRADRYEPDLVEEQYPVLVGPNDRYLGGGGTSERANDDSRASFSGTPKEERTQRRLAKFARMDRRYALIIDVDGPKVRMGVIWFVALVFASAVGRYSVSALFMVVTVVAALQVAAHLMIEEDRRSRLVAGGIAGLLTFSAIWGPRPVGACVLVAIIAAAAVGNTTIDPEWRWPVAAMTIRSGLFIGLAGASAVLAHRVDSWAYFFLIFALSAYEAGSFLVGSGARNQLQGPLAGALLVGVVTLGASAFEFAPLTAENTVVFGVMFAVLGPLGQLLGTALLPRADCKAPALRRIDSFLLAGPAYVIGLWIASGNLHW